MTVAITAQEHHDHGMRFLLHQIMTALADAVKTLLDTMADATRLERERHDMLLTILQQLTVDIDVLKARVTTLEQANWP